MTTRALLKLRRADVGGPEAYRMPGYPWLPVFYLVGIVALLISRAVFAWQQSLVDLAFVATGLPVSWFWLRRGRRDEA